MLVYAYRVLVAFSVAVVALYVAWIFLVPKPGMAEELPPAISTGQPGETDSPEQTASADQRKEDCWRSRALPC